ncbi:Endothelin-converting enzyme 2 [Teratosphaeria destructans]|uniref:Endothelin-converting enzyme 2 n=1 Tax=Teratosphaeria destructans TaxID=418781 RepID=A0A9W7T0U1_9PEZI|nr:Endothelin-converting enzyme 2 [Teratosphaeria destructans]
MSSEDEAGHALGRAAFWDERYARSDGAAPTHEWFRTFKDLQPFLERHLFQSFRPAQDPRILHLGAGDSTFPHDLAELGYRNQSCVDFSAVLVRSMAARAVDGVTWAREDVRRMPHVASRSIDVAFDKGTLDAMIYGSPWSPPEEVKENTRRYMHEVSRALKDDGVFLYVTYRQPHFVKPLLNQDGLWDLTHEALSAGGDSFEYYGFVLRKANELSTSGHGRGNGSS